MNKYAKSIKENLIKFNLPIILTLFLILGITYPPPGAYLQRSNLGGGICFSNNRNCVYNSVSHICIACAFFIFGLTLDSQQSKKALGSIKPFVLGMFLILFITPLMAFAVATSSLLQNPPEFALGLSIFFAVPSTLNIGIAVTKLANGNVALASLLTIASNIIGVFLVPVYVTWLVPICLKSQNVQSLHVDLDPTDMIIKLAFSVLLPMICGKVCRDWIPGIPDCTSNNKIKLTLLSSVSVGMVPWMQASVAADVFKQVSAASIVSVIFIFFAVHSYHIVQNYIISAKIFKISESENKAIMVMSTQKGLPVCLSVLAALPPSIVPSLALASIPPIISQLAQTFMDSILAVKWADYTASHGMETSNKSDENNNNNPQLETAQEREITKCSSFQSQNSDKGEGCGVKRNSIDNYL